MHKKGLQYVYRCTYVAAVGGLLFGYDTAVISGAIGFITDKYTLSPAQTGWIASCALIGCVIGAMLAGPVSDAIGRKKVLVFSAVAFAVSSLGILVPWGLSAFVLFRLIGGIGIGIASMIAPLYISELAPAAIRGRLVSIYQMGIVCGILTVYFVNAGIAGLHTAEWNIDTGWRWMFGSGLLPSILFLVLLIIVPESPRWLAGRERLLEAGTILDRINGAAKAKEELQAIRDDLSTKENNFADLLSPAMRKRLLIGIILAIFSQVTGMNAILYYAPEIFKSTGDGASSAMLQTVLIGIINLLFTLVAIRYADQWGRRKLLLIGSGGMALCLAIIGTVFYYKAVGSYLILVAILAYIACFAVSLGPMTFVVVSEIFPTAMRGKAMSVCIFFLWAAVYLVSQTFPMLQAAIGEAPTFWIYMSMSVLCYVFVWKMVPETKGKTLEEIGASLKQ
ncbi:sugar porter family MFS transporter [Pseudoflavitalea sp. X16]|uniref:sugar porter family MFS transporter n=1 Tax=Paraflavitalea devenefica TaxID=2716334 RepID=UPI00141E5C17|nr:sugar porter family MFS transporter [Paraflavitalea devenefica]NII23520.1 sugar porter family MFS transporter [Paraflavitalea devenefica]